MSPNDRATYVVSGVCCATEERVLRKAFDAAVGRTGYDFNPVTCELKVSAPVEGVFVLRELRHAGFAGRRKEVAVDKRTFLARHAEALMAGSAGLLTVAGLMAGGPAAVILYASAIALGGWRIVRRAFGALRTRVLDMNVLMSVAVIGAMIIGKWEEGAAVVVLFAVALMLESYSNERTRNALRSLMALSPGRAAVVKADREESLPLEAVAPGDIIMIRPGERVPLDGVVTDGVSTVDEAPVTGESLPAHKVAGGQVYAGTLNGNGALRVRVTRHAGDSAIARISACIEEAQHARAPVQQTVDRVAGVYTPAVLFIAFLVAAVPPLFPGHGTGEWLYRALVLLVIACPCALVISTPVAMVSAMSRAARNGVLIKGGAHVETLARVTAVAFDKTGTLTAGTPRVTDVVALESCSREEILGMTAALEHRSEHHLARAALQAAETSSVHYDTLAVEAFEALPGRGVRGTIDGTTYYLGNRRLCDEIGFRSPVVDAALEAFAAQGKTAIVLGRPGVPLGIVAFRDGVRHHGREAIERLRRMGIRWTVILSGDTPAASRAIAAELSIDEVRAGLLPAEKVAAVQELKRTHRAVAMVGDGINDAPALAASSVGIAMGVAGTDVALDTADVILMSDDLTHLPYVFGLSRAALRIVRQNIALAIGVKILFLTLALTGHATLWMAVLADDGAALAVILNAMRVLAYAVE